MSDIVYSPNLSPEANLLNLLAIIGVKKDNTKFHQGDTAEISDSKAIFALYNLLGNGLIGAAGGSLAGTYPNPSIAPNVNLPASPTTTTQASSDNSAKVATTAFAQSLAAGSPYIVTPLSLAALTGSTPTTLDGQTTAGLLGKVVMVIGIPGSPLQFFQVVAGSGPTNLGSNPVIVVGSDTGSTNLVFSSLN